MAIPKKHFTTVAHFPSFALLKPLKVWLAQPRGMVIGVVK